jgi:hypothetical protein
MGVEVGRFRFDGLPSRRYASSLVIHRFIRKRGIARLTRPPSASLTHYDYHPLGEVYDYIICGEHPSYFADLNLNGAEQVEE